MNISRIDKLSEKYLKTVPLRAALQLIPYIGSSLDTLFCGKGAKIQEARVRDLIEQLSTKLAHFEGAKELPDTEEFYDLSVSIFEEAARSRSQLKRIRFASILVNQVENPSGWEEAEMAVRLISTLEDLHIDILRLATTAPTCTEPFNDLKVIALENKISRIAGDVTPLDISSQFPQIKALHLRMACSELVSKGLLHDIGVDRMATDGMQYFISTDLCDWLISWIANE